mmetsp:Transcript_16730/g.32579  ORF Transcript_16730/g.32579 Transcript_16730/m.32579 type:complete len:219 (-) Transcript_16730:893-1549(-)
MFRLDSPYHFAQQGEPQTCDPPLGVDNQRSCNSSYTFGEMLLIMTVALLNALHVPKRVRATTVCAEEESCFGLGHVRVGRTEQRRRDDMQGNHPTRRALCLADVTLQQAYFLEFVQKIVHQKASKRALATIPCSAHKHTRAAGCAGGDSTSRVLHLLCDQEGGKMDSGIWRSLEDGKEGREWDGGGYILRLQQCGLVAFSCKQGGWMGRRQEARAQGR